MVFLFENEKILQQAEFKNITTLSYANEQNDTTGGYQPGGTGSQSLLLTNYRIILVNSSGEDYPGNRLLMKNIPTYLELSSIFYGKDTFIQFINTIVHKHKQIYDSLLNEKGAGVVGETLKLAGVREYFPYIKVVSGVGYEIEKHNRYKFTYFNSSENSIPTIPKKNQYAIKLLDAVPLYIEQPIILDKIQKKFSSWIARRSSNMIARADRLRSNILLLKPLKNNDKFGDTFMKTLVESTQDVQSTFKNSKECADYYRDLFTNLFSPQA